MYHVFVVSDGTGGTAERALNAALVQFEGMSVKIVRRQGVRTEEQVHEIVREAEKAGGFIVHTLVSNELRDTMVHLGRLRNVETIDLMGPLLARLSQQFAVSPSEKPGLFSQLTDEYFRRMETMEFAFRHDDGLHVEELYQAEIILVGVSRTFKTPLSVYLAFKGWFAANIPIVLNIPPPPVLNDIPPGRVFGLTINSRWLASLRRMREQHLGRTIGDYADLDHVRREVVYALKIFDQPPKWPVIDVTGKPIEETASEILALAGGRR